jgi:hypothetical protein
MLTLSRSCRIRIIGSIVIASGCLFTNYARSQNIPRSVINSLYTPNSSQQFFYEGRELLNREEEILKEQKLFSSPKILKIKKEQLQNNFDRLKFKSLSFDRIDFKLRS